MTPMTMDRRDRAWFDDHAHEWVDAGLISAGQADAIRHFEHLDEPASPQRLTLVAEVATYLGSLIAFAGGAAIVGPNWDEIGVVGQVVLGLAIAAVGYVVGTWLVAQAESGTVRLGSFMWVVGTGGVGLGVGAVMNEIDPAEEGWYGVAIGLVVLVLGLGLWRNLERPLQLLTAVVGLVVAAAGSSSLVEVSVWVTSPVVWAASMAFGVAAATGRIHPRFTALAVAAVGLMIGSFVLADESERLAAIVAVVSAAGIVAFALYERSWPLVGIGLFAFFVATTSMMQTVLHGMVARMIAVVVGLAVVAVVAMRAQKMGRPGPSSV